MKRNEFILSGTPRGRGFYGGPVLARPYGLSVSIADIIAEITRPVTVAEPKESIFTPSRPLPVAK